MLNKSDPSISVFLNHLFGFKKPVMPTGEDYLLACIPHPHTVIGAAALPPHSQGADQILSTNKSFPEDTVD